MSAQYSGSCVACLAGTDTGLAFSGSLEWLAAGLVVLGVPSGEAIAMVSDSSPVLDGAGRGTLTYRVCAACAGRSGKGLPKPGLLINGGSTPCLAQAEADL